MYQTALQSLRLTLASVLYRVGIAPAAAQNRHSRSLPDAASFTILLNDF